MKNYILALTLTQVFAAAASANLIFYGPADQLSFETSSVISIVETFDSVFPKDRELASFVSQKVTYAGVGGSRIGTVWGTSRPYDNLGVVGPDATVLTANGNEDFTIGMTFVGPITAVGFDTYLNSYGGATIEIENYDGWTAIASNHDPMTVGFFAVTSSSPITTIRRTTVGGAIVNTGIDNVLLGILPTPSGVLLGLIGGMGIMGMKLRKYA
jgi:hypothetical protein